MFLVYFLLIAASSSATGNSQRRNYNIRKTKPVNNNYRNDEFLKVPTSFKDTELDESDYGFTRQYFPIHRIRRYKQTDINRRSDSHITTEDDTVRNYPLNRTVRSNLKKYVTSDEIRPTRLQYLTNKSNNKRHYANSDNSAIENNNQFIFVKSKKDNVQQNQMKVIKYDDAYAPNFENKKENFQTYTTTSRPQEKDTYSTFSVEQYLKNPFLASVLNKSPTTAFLPPIETSPPSVQYLPPIQTTDFSPSPEITNRNYQPILIPPNLEPPTNFQSVSIVNDIPIFSQEIDVNQINEPITVPPQIVHSEIYNLQLTSNSPPKTVFLPPKISSELHPPEVFSDHVYNDQADDVIDQFQQEALREMSFESVKLGAPSPTPVATPEFSANPVVERLPRVVQESYTLPPIINETPGQVISNPLGIDTGYASQRRNDFDPDFSQLPYSNKPMKQFQLDQPYFYQSGNLYPQNLIERSSRDHNWQTEQLITEHNQRVQQEERNKHVEKEFSDSLQPTPYGRKITSQQQYLPIASRSNDQQGAHFETVIEDDKSFMSTTLNYDDTLNINNINKPQEFVSPISTVSQTQEYVNIRPTQKSTNHINPSDNFKQNQDYSTQSQMKQVQEYPQPNNIHINQDLSSAMNNKFSQGQVSTSTVTYPREFTKALEMYVENQKPDNPKQRQEKSVEKKLRQPKEYSREFLQRSEKTSVITNNDLFGESFIDSQQGVFTQPLNYTYFRGPTTEPVPVLRQIKEMDMDGSFHYETLIGDQTHVIQEGHIENPGTEDEEQVIHGSYSFLGDDGRTYTVNYVADSNGFRASGDHLPTPPPIPEIIQRSIEKNLAEAEKNPDILDGNYKLNANFNDNNGFRDRSSNIRPIYTNNYKNVNPASRLQNWGNDYNSKNTFNQNQQPVINNIIQPRKDGFQVTDLYTKQRPNNNLEKIENQPIRNTNDVPVITRRSDEDLEEMFVDKEEILKYDTKIKNKLVNTETNLENKTINEFDNNIVQNIRNGEIQSLNISESNYNHENNYYKTDQSANDNNKYHEINPMTKVNDNDNINYHENTDYNDVKYTPIDDSYPDIITANSAYSNNNQMTDFVYYNIDLNPNSHEVNNYGYNSLPNHQHNEQRYPTDKQNAEAVKS